jgi:hypothetical protein
MATNSMQYIVDTIIDALNSDGNLTPRRIWRPDAYESKTTICYPYISQMQYDTDAETGLSLGLGRALVEIMCNAMIEADPSELGIANERAGDIASRIKYALETYDLDAIGSNNDGRFYTAITSMHVDGNVGEFNTGSNKIQMGIAVTVTFVIRPV